MKLLVTGASGFVGQALCQHLAGLQHEVLAQSRQASSLSKDEHLAQYLCRLHADLAQIIENTSHLQGIEAVVHCAARVHQVNEANPHPLAAYREINTQATLDLAHAAARAGVRRFVFLSSVKVNGEYTLPGQAFRADQAQPQDPYGISKWEAEQGLQEIAAKTGMQFVIIRPPLVYGPGVKANFLTMMQWLNRGIPLPLGAINNRRSLVALPNFVDFIALCLTHPKAANQTFLISDQQDVSTTELLQGLGAALKRPARLTPVPQSLLELSLKALGKGGMAQRLCGDLTVDSNPATQLLGWKPPFTVQQGLQLTADHFLRP
ncbi:SDR family oxidoreductase [Variovorax sp. PCZ-1]|uniref:UDP-glucose 4-epimerase family protein n=1 Tax=Variovorax sp. PCZ-1 TaxID=2835533 RepID=UPI001BCCF2EA|nr:SDR family oxidoreductase [Variovorax sp. PCZ-1]MBS7808561.1 SDR family oxidoreductase [Variovorax sp. PCZ-1]